MHVCFSFYLNKGGGTQRQSEREKRERENKKRASGICGTVRKYITLLSFKFEKTKNAPQNNYLKKKMSVNFPQSNKMNKTEMNLKGIMLRKRNSLG